ncbi:excinuclease ABC subunit C, partial [Candidatus Peregrinibacteria bacterium RIFCSPLOWO2_02_FULL_39_10]
MPDKKNIKRILGNLPHNPGIYKMMDKDGKIIYIGKAKDLNKRIRQYFQKNYEHSTRTKKMKENTEDIKITVVDSDLEAVILEHNLMKEFKPKYNVVMKDDKNYVYIKITNEDFPRIQIVRRVEKDNAKYIGPKTAAHKVEDTLRILKNILLFRHCGLDIKFTDTPTHIVEVSKKTIKYPCLDFYTNRCVGPCIGKCTPEEYKKIITDMENFFAGRADEIFKTLREQMNNYAEIRNFEKAAKIRDKIKKLEDILEKQKVSDPNQEDKDIINYCVTQGKAYFNLFQIRGGKLIGQENFTLSALDADENSQNQEILEEFLKQYYCLATDIPKEILIPHNLENEQEIKNFVDKIANKKILFLVPKQGIKNRLLDMSLNNARIFADRQKFSWRTQDDLTEKAAKDLKKLLGLKNDLKRIECYDISHLSGTETVGSMIV